MKSLYRTMLAAIVVAVAAGCGQNVSGPTVTTASTAPATYGYTTTDPYNNATYPSVGTPPASPLPTPVPLPSIPEGTDPASGSIGASPSPSVAPTPMPTVPPSLIGDYGLRIINVTKTTSGVLWFKKAHTVVQVQNPLLTQRQTGTVRVLFFLSGSIVGNPVSSALNLAPGEIKSFTFAATSHTDDSVATVTTDGH